MLQSFASEKGNPVRPFNPTILQCDEHISNYKGIEAVFGKTFFEKRTASCEYHFDKSVNKHQRLVSDEDKIDYKILISGMKNAVSDAYIRVKRQLEKLIKRQNAAVSKSLTDTLNFWIGLNIDGLRHLNSICITLLDRAWLKQHRHL